MTGLDPRPTALKLRRLAGSAGSVMVTVMMIVASLWASEPGAADPPESSWLPGHTVTTWDWEQHWNYWMEWECISFFPKPSIGKRTCRVWSPVGPIWKPCGPVIRPPQPGHTNTCNIGKPGGHRPHGDNIWERYTYLGRHEDRTGSTYAVCVDDPALPADTSPGNCGTWVEVSHVHCPQDHGNHPPDCPPPETASPNEEPVLTIRTGTGPWTYSSEPDISLPHQSGICSASRIAEVLAKAVDEQPDPGHGLTPPANGYVGVPLRASYPHDTSVRMTVTRDGGPVDLRIRVARVSWSLTGVGTSESSDRRARSFHRSAPDHHGSRALNRPAQVIIDGREGVYPRSSSRGGYPRGYPVTVTVVWRTECRADGIAGFAVVGEEIRRFHHHYQVYEIRSRPDQAAPPESTDPGGTNLGYL